MRRRPRREVRTQRRIGTARAADRRPSPGGGREYAEQAGKIHAPVLYVNSVCLDSSGDSEIAKGGAALFEKGSIKEELPAGKEGTLIVEC